jgi:hypothetical protein
MVIVKVAANSIASYSAVMASVGFSVVMEDVVFGGAAEVAV